MATKPPTGTRPSHGTTAASVNRRVDELVRQLQTQGLTLEQIGERLTVLDQRLEEGLSNTGVLASVTGFTRQEIEVFLGISADSDLRVSDLFGAIIQELTAARETREIVNRHEVRLEMHDEDIAVLQSHPNHGLDMRQTTVETHQLPSWPTGIVIGSLTFLFMQFYAIENFSFMKDWRNEQLFVAITTGVVICLIVAGLTTRFASRLVIPEWDGAPFQPGEPPLIFDAPQAPANEPTVPLPVADQVPPAPRQETRPSWRHPLRRRAFDQAQQEPTAS